MDLYAKCSIHSEDLRIDTFSLRRSYFLPMLLAYNSAAAL